jgi:hypothetical protein
VTIDDLVSALQAPLVAVLRGLYAAARADPDVAFMTRLVPGCTASELADAETRVGYALPPLHRSVLSLSNGGSLPYVNSLEYLAAAVPRESAWHLLGPLPGDSFDEDQPTYRPDRPLILGTPLDGLLTGVGVDVARFPAPGLKVGAFIVMGLGYFDLDGIYCYNREDPWPVYGVGQAQYGAYVVARDFDEFIRRQVLFTMCETPAFLAQMQATLHAPE